MRNFEKLQIVLSKTEKSATQDSIIFYRWERGEISTASCLRRFREHNMIGDRYDISQIEFELWLNSLGYIRRREASLAITRRTKEYIIEEYNRNVREINRNLEELERADPDSVALERYKGEFWEIHDPNYSYNALRAQNKKAKEVLSSGAVSVEGQERSIANALKTLHEEGYDYINRRNFNSFMRFLDDARAKGLGALYSSTQLIDKIKEMKNRSLTKGEILANIDRWARKNVKRDKEGKVIEQIKPKKLYIRTK